MAPALTNGAGDSTIQWQRERSDSEVAREMQAEIDGSILMDMSNPSSGSNFHFESEPIGGSWVRSDSQVARELQAKWDNEEFDSSDIATLTPPENFDTFPSVSSPLPQSNRALSAPTSASFSPSIRSHLHRHDR